MSTQVMDQVTSKSSLSADQQARAAAFAQKELQHAGDALATIPSYSGSGTVTYNVSFLENSDGFAQIGWSVSSSLGMFCVQQNDWVGMFTNYDQALHNPSSNYLGGLHGCRPAWWRPTSSRARPATTWQSPFPRRSRAELLTLNHSGAAP
jgi:hypothetical protein